MPTVEQERARMEAAMQREIERDPESNNSSSSAASSGYQGIPDKNPGQWQWVWNEYYNDRPYMQAGVMKNSVTGEIKKTAFRDIRNDKGQIQKSLLHEEGNAFRAKLNEDNGYNAWAKEQARLKKIEQDRVAAEVKAKEEAAAKAAAEAKAAKAAADKAKAKKAAKAKAAAAKAAAEKARKEAEAAKAAAKAKAEEEARLAQIAEQKRIQEEYEAKIAEEKRLREAAEKAQREAAERQRIEEERRRAEEARKAAEAEAARIAAEKARRTAEAQRVAQDRIEGRVGETYSPFSGESASVYNPPGYEEGKAAPLSGPTTVASETADEPSKVFAPGYIEGAIPQTISLPSATTTGMSQTVMYSNERGQQLPVTEIDGKAVTYIPPGFSKVSMAQGGVVGYAQGGDTNLDAKYQLATKFLGYKGPKTIAGLTDFAKANPGAGARMGMYEQAMARGGMVRGLAEGGDNISYKKDIVPMFGDTLKQTMQPMQAPVEYMKATDDQMISPTAGQVYGTAPTTEAATVGQVSQAQAPTYVPASTYQAGTVTPFVQAETEKLKAATGTVSADAQIDAAQGTISDAAIANAAQFDPNYINRVNMGNMNVTSDQLVNAAGQDEVAPAVKIAQSSGIEPAVAQQATVSVNELPEAAQIAESNMAQAKVAQSGGLLREEATAYAAKLDTFSVDNGTLAKAIQGEVGALGTVQGQLEGLMSQFDDGTPTWAAGAMRAANAAMAARGLGGSSMAGAAILQAAMESALPIAQQDAQTFNQMNMSNLNRRQQVSLTNAAAQQGLALQNLSNEQQVALQNSTNAFALQAQDLSNMQQTFLANAQIKSALQGQNLSNQQQTNLVTAARFAEVSNMNLNNRQQTALVNNANNLQIELSNLSNQQQAYVSNAQLSAALQGKQIDNQQQAAIQNAARFAEVSNINFTAEQQEQLHNSELMKTIGLTDLTNRQAAVLQNAATLANMDMANLNNRQQAAVQNAQNFLAMDMANLNNEQQTAMFKTQQNIQSLFTDQAAENAAAQFNAANENQTRQFFSSLSAQTSQFNASQTNAVNQFNVNSVNAIRQFNSNLQQQRDTFNATNSLVVAQANAQWRQNIATLNTAAQNESNREFAQTINSMTSKNIDAVWQRERDLMSYNFTSTESAKDRALQILVADKELQQLKESMGYAEDTAKTELAFRFLFGDSFGGLFGR